MEKSVREKYRVVIGLEVHAQLLTASKIYNADPATYGGAPNSQVSVITLAHPGTLPKLNKVAAEHAMKMGLACHCEISRTQIFDRKNYFYPDLPKGYQLTQDRTPICKGGYVTIVMKAGEKKVQLNRIHIEEDAGKSIHLDGEEDTLLDFNRAGVPLIEIVTEPVLTSSEEAGAFLLEVRKLVRYLDICDGNMEEGSLRCDANVSIMLADATEFGKKVEIKNMNSIRNVQRAIDNEIARQITEVEKGRAIISETRTYDANLDKTFGMRTKEELNDYRYFPDPDLSPMEVSDAWLEKIRSHMPLLPDQLKQKLISDYQLPAYDAQVLTDEKEIAFYFMEICTHTTNFKAASNWMMGPVKSYLNDKSVSVQNFPITPAMMASLIAIIDEGVVNFSVASQKIFPVMAEHPDKSPKAIAKELDLIQESDASTLVPIVDQVIKEFPLKVEEYKNGKKGIVSMFMGEVMKRTKGNADPKLSTELLTKKLNEL